MRCFKVTLEYDGTDFSGFQYQVGQRSVQAEVERAVERITGVATRVAGAGRTDSGVHALGQVVSFQAETRIPLEKMAIALNSALPADTAAVRAEEVDERFHARFSALSRAYVYVMLRRPQRSALFRRYAWWYPYQLDVQAMREGAALLKGERDYAAWANDVSEARTTVRHVARCEVRQAGPFLLVRMEANGFLRGMVRNVVGTLVDIGSGKRRAEDIEQITASLRRENAGPSAPPQGLCLTRVRY